jgi:hypothetical protein
VGRFRGACRVVAHRGPPDCSRCPTTPKKYPKRRSSPQPYLVSVSDASAALRDGLYNTNALGNGNGAMMGFAARRASVGGEPFWFRAIPHQQISERYRPRGKSALARAGKPRALICDCFALFLNNFPDRLLGRTIKIRFSS